MASSSSWRLPLERAAVIRRSSLKSDQAIDAHPASRCSRRMASTKASVWIGSKSTPGTWLPTKLMPKSDSPDTTLASTWSAASSITRTRISG